MGLIRVCFNSVLYKYKFEGGGGGINLWYMVLYNNVEIIRINIFMEYKY